MKAIVINFNSEFRFNFDKHTEIDGLFAISIPFISVSFWNREANKLLCTATQRTFKNKEFIVKDSAEWDEKFNSAMQEYKEGTQKDYKNNVDRIYKTIYEKDKHISDLLNENIALRKVIKICSEDDVIVKFGKVQS